MINFTIRALNSDDSADCLYRYRGRRLNWEFAMVERFVSIEGWKMFPFRMSVVFLVCLAVAPLQAGVINNGDFSDLVVLNGFVATGTTVDEPTGDFAQLETDGTFVRSLETDPFAIPTTASTLSFDYAFSTTLSPALFKDSFAASLITSVDFDFLDLFVVDSVNMALPDPSGGIESLTGNAPFNDDTISIVGFTEFVGGTTYFGRVSIVLPSSVLGEEATLYFDLFDQNDGANSIAAVDNITITSSSGAIPEPASFAVWSLMIVGATLRRRRR